MRALRLTLAIMGYTLLAFVAIAGVTTSGLVLWARTPSGRELVATQVVGVLDRQLAGRFELAGLVVLAGGEVELTGLKVFDPVDRLVLAVDRAIVSADVTRLRSGVLTVSVELIGPAVLVDEDEDGRLSLVSAFQPVEPTVTAGPTSGPTLTLRLGKVAVQGGSLWWRDAGGATRLQAHDLGLEGRGSYGRAAADLDLALRAMVDLPMAAPFSLDVRGSLTGDAVTLPVLRATLGPTTLEAAGEGELARRAGRLAISRLTVDRAQARALAPAIDGGGDLGATAYLESDGKLATVALVATPSGDSGAARAAVAVRLADLASGATPAAGLDLALEALDPSRLLAGLPAGAVTLTARGGAAGRSLEALRGRLEAHLERSTVRGVALGPGDLRARAEDGTVEVAKLALVGPGVSVEGAGSWRRGGVISGRLTVDGADLAAASRAASRLAGRPLPAASGAVRLEATVSGTEPAPVLAATLTSPGLAVEGTSVRGLSATLSAAGPSATGRGALDLTAEALRMGGGETARRMALRATLLEGGEATLSGSAVVPSLGAQPVALSGHGTLDAQRERLAVAELSLGWPGERWALTGPTTVVLAGPSVDRLELASGDQRLAVEGGLSGGALAVRLQTVELDLARVPRGVAPEGIAGRVTLDARATGTTANPVATARFRVEAATVAGLEGLSAEGEAGWDGKAGRARLAAQLARKQGGRVEVDGELPVPLATPRSEPLALRLRAEGLPLAEALLAAGKDLPLDGKVGVVVALTGTTAAPSLTAEVTLTDAAWDDLYPVEGSLALAAPGEELTVKAGLAVDGKQALAADAKLPLDLADALARPEEVAGKLARAPLEAVVVVPSFDLVAVAGAVSVPRDVTGTLDARAELGGTLEAPRGTIAAGLSRLAVAGYRELAARLEARLLGDRVTVEAGASLAGAELLRAKASLAGAPERLARPGELGKATLAFEAEVPKVDLSRASSPDVAFGGVFSGNVQADGTLAAPSVTAAFEGSDLTVQGRPLGALDAGATYADGKTEGMARLRPKSGGELRAIGTVTARLGLGVRDDLARAPLDARLVAEAVDLGFLPALAPGTVREAHGKLEGEVHATGPLSRPSPKGRLTVSEARLAVAEYGDWTRIAVDVEVNDDALELRKLEAHRGKGTFEGRGSVRGLAGASAAIEGTARFDQLTIARAGMDLATLDLSLTATGAYRRGAADVEVRVPGGTIRLPRKIPRTLQTLEQRPDIVVGRPRERKKPARPRPSAGEVAPEDGPFRLTVHTVVPGQLFVKSDDPRANVELKADVTYELAGEEEYASGEITVVRGFVEPLGGRLFDLTRGSVQFTGGPPTAALVDVEAKWESADKIKVTVTVAGPALEPQIKLTSMPALDDAQIALLIATGRTELKRGSGEVASLTPTDAASQALSAVVSTAFKNLLANKLPIDTLAFDASSVRAGTYLPNSKIYVGYVYRFEANLEKGQNQNEVSVEYQITPRWTLESRYGDGQSGSASLIWSRDY